MYMYHYSRSPSLVPEIHGEAELCFFSRSDKRRPGVVLLGGVECHVDTQHPWVVGGSQPLPVCQGHIYKQEMAGE